jgi:DNA-binding Lrp family transcriptional regulator
MRKIPDRVSETYERLRKEMAFPVRLQLSGGRYYLYKQLTVWDKEKKRGRSVAKYLGKILDDGTFVRKADRDAAKDLDVARAVIISCGGTVTLPKKIEMEAKPFSMEDVDKKILTNLSMNCRMPVSAIARRVGISTTSAVYRKRNLEKRYGIRYLNSINIHWLGFSYYVAFVKFEGEKPNAEELKETIRQEQRIQLALLTTGRYDLMLCILAETDNKLNEVVTTLHRSETLKRHTSSWMLTTYVDHYGYVPLRDEFFELLKGRVWQRTKETPRPLRDQLLKSEYAVLRELNNDGEASFSEIDKKYGLNKGNARYTYEKLKEKRNYTYEELADKKVLLRNTLTMDKLAIRYNTIIIMEILNSKEFLEQRESLFRYITENTEGVANRFSAIGDIVTPYGMMLIAPIFKENELEDIMEGLNERIKGVRLDTLLVTEVLVGELFYRRFDNMHAQQYAQLINEYKIRPQQELTEYG